MPSWAAASGAGSRARDRRVPAARRARAEHVRAVGGQQERRSASLRQALHLVEQSNSGPRRRLERPLGRDQVDVLATTVAGSRSRAIASACSSAEAAAVSRIVVRPGMVGARSWSRRLAGAGRAGRRRPRLRWRPATRSRWRVGDAECVALDGVERAVRRDHRRRGPRRAARCEATVTAWSSCACREITRPRYTLCSRIAPARRRASPGRRRGRARCPRPSAGATHRPVAWC